MSIRHSWVCGGLLRFCTTRKSPTELNGFRISRRDAPRKNVMQSVADLAQDMYVSPAVWCCETGVIRFGLEICRTARIHVQASEIKKRIANKLKDIRTQVLYRGHSTSPPPLQPANTAPKIPSVPSPAALHQLVSRLSFTFVPSSPGCKVVGTLGEEHLLRVRTLKEIVVCPE